MVLVAAANGQDSSSSDDSSSSSSVKHRAECAMWAKLENKTLPLQNQGHANCTTNEQCTGFECLGMYKVIQ